MKNINNFKQFVNEINLDNGRNYKISVLEKYKDDESVKFFLQQVYDPYIIFGISEKKLNKNVGFQAGTLWLDYVDDKVIFDYLSEHNTGTDVDIWTVQKFRDSHIKDENKELFNLIITKNLILGISASTINKVFGKNTIREFSVQLAEKYFDQKENFLDGKSFAITTKIDGMRCVMIKKNGNITFWSRQGQPIEGLVDLITEIKKIKEDNFVFDGELIAKETDKADTYKNTMKTARTKEAEKHNLKMMVFDYLTIDELENQVCKETYFNRRNKLENIFNNNFEYFNLLPILYSGSDSSKITDILNQQVSNGEEGIMINIDAPYEFKRTKNLLKCKLFNSCDLRITGFEEGTGKNKNTLGALLLEYKDNIVKCGSGFSDSQRTEIWTNQNKYLDTIVEITYFEETENATGTKSLRFPVFKDFRTDKTEPNY